MEILFYFLLAILSGFFTALSDVFSRKYIKKYSTDSFFTLYVRWLFCSILLLPLFSFKPPEITKEIMLLYALLFPLEISAGYLYIKSIEVSEASLVLPFQSFTPAFIPIFAHIIIGEKYSPKGLIGIFLIVSGSFIILRGKTQSSEKKGIVYMLGAALIYSITSVLGRFTILKTSPLFFSASYILSLSLILTPFFLKKYKMEGIKKIKKTFSDAVVLGLFTALAVLCHFVSVVKIETGYMISLKRTSVIFSVILGYIILKEKTDFKDRITGAILMLSGVIVIGKSIIK